MSESVIVALITGAITLVGTILTVTAQTKKTDESIRVNQAVIDTKLEELTREVRTHNNFAQRLPVVEEQVKQLTDRVENIEKRT